VSEAEEKSEGRERTMDSNGSKRSDKGLLMIHPLRRGAGMSVAITDAAGGRRAESGERVKRRKR
jgi:hypothetical protein